MCTSPHCTHDDDDPFAGLGEDPTSIPVGPSPEVNIPGTYTEPCKKCRGSGRFISYSGRPLGPCFACKGAGKLTFRTSAKQREQSRDSAARSRARKVEETRQKGQDWMDDNPIEAKWISAKAGSFDFAASMAQALLQYGHLTDNQLAAVRRCLLRDEERELQRERERNEREQKAQAIDITPIIDAFERARGNGIRSPKLRLDTFLFSRAPDHGANAG